MRNRHGKNLNCWLIHWNLPGGDIPAALEGGYDPKGTTLEEMSQLCQQVTKACDSTIQYAEGVTTTIEDLAKKKEESRSIGK